MVLEQMTLKNSLLEKTVLTRDMLMQVPTDMEFTSQITQPTQWDTLTQNQMEIVSSYFAL